MILIILKINRCHGAPIKEEYDLSLVTCYFKEIYDVQDTKESMV